MSTRRALTGGTGDLNPQFYTMSVTQASANANVSATFQLPIAPVQTGSRRAQVVEVLKVFFYQNSALADTSSSWLWQLKTGNNEDVDTADPTTIAYAQSSIDLSTGTERVEAEIISPIIQDLTDGAGHGVLVATPRIRLSFVSVGLSAEQTVVVRMLYRVKDVGLQEYLGMVQSQQSAF